MIRFIGGHRDGEIFTGPVACRYAEDIHGGVIFRYELIGGAYRFDKAIKPRDIWREDESEAA